MNAECRSQNEEVKSGRPDSRCQKSELRNRDGVADLKSRTKQFAVRIVVFYNSLVASEPGRVIGRQLLRSGTSVAANYRACCRARSRAELVAKLGIVLEEADETVFWLELLSDAGLVQARSISALAKEANELVSIFVASLNTAKSSQ